MPAVPSSETRPIVVFGAGQTAEVAAFYLEGDGCRNVAGFCVDAAYLPPGNFLGRPVVPLDGLASAFPPESHDIFVALSFAGLNRPRAEKYAQLTAMGYRAVRFVHSRAMVAPDIPIGPNCLILENNVVQVGTRIGSNTFLWSGNHVGHHSVIGDHCYISSHVVISGATVIGDYTFIGVNATIRDNISIGCRNIIGAASIILSDTKDGSVFRAEETKVRRVSSDRVAKI